MIAVHDSQAQQIGSKILGQLRMTPKEALRDAQSGSCFADVTCNQLYTARWRERAVR